MTRGKYAAKANGHRAETATNTANSLRTQLDTARTEHAAEVADLKQQIGALQGRLEHEVHQLAANEVAFVRTHARQMIEDERAAARNSARTVMAILNASGALSHLTQDVAGSIADQLGLDRNEVFASTDGNRQERRITKKKMRYADSLIRDGYRTEDLQNGAGVGAHAIVAKGSTKTFTVGSEVADNA